MKGKTLLVEGDMQEVSDQLTRAQPGAATFMPMWLGGEPEPEPIAVRISDVLMLADASGRGRLARARVS